MQNKKIVSVLAIGIIFAVTFLIGANIWSINNNKVQTNPSNNPKGIVQTQENLVQSNIPELQKINNDEANEQAIKEEQPPNDEYNPWWYDNNCDLDLSDLSDSSH